MTILRRLFSLTSLVFLFLFAPAIFAANKGKAVASREMVSAAPVTASNSAAAIDAESNSMYEEMGLSATGLAKTAFTLAYRGYKNLVNKGAVRHENIITVADFSQSSRKKRLYIIDVENKDVIMQTYVAHGRNSGKEFAKSFSNKLSSLKSSLGFYITKGTYFGEHGLSLRIEGVDRGFNDNAYRRAVVVHGADYLGESFVQNNPFSGRSWGCPAVPARQSKEIINTIKDGTVMFIYHPSQQYLKKSRILNS
ncbi:MAG TPA: murein L,D-transpeptidase catalytic domain family protein [Chitinophagaceae bacterium]|nr:murein L,D-transpeptidase catalytic domain family protein [Chitinophagaceae bacterium]